MTLKGTLDTFDLRELVQMLSFNHKVGTLRLQTVSGSRAIYVDRGRLTLPAADADLNRSAAREVRRSLGLDPAIVEDALRRAATQGAYVLDMLTQAGRIEAGRRDGLHRDAVLDCLLDAQLADVRGFEFHDGRAVGPDLQEVLPASPLVPVEGLLLELTRRLDVWEVVRQIVPSFGEIFEGTGIAVDIASREGLPEGALNAALPHVDGYSSVEAISERSDVSRFDVAQVMAAMVEMGGVRAVATDVLLERATERLAADESAGALAMLERAVARGDAAPRTRFRLAEVLEKLGRRSEAIEHLEQFIQGHAGADVEGGFEALRRLLALQDQDPRVARRLCDHYLRYRPELRAQRSVAKDALGIVIRHAVGEDGARGAAERLVAFIEQGDAPSEDLGLLAELYVRANAPHRAAQALTQRAEDMLAAGRLTPAREFLRRAVRYDAGCATARRRLAEIDAERGRRRARRRIRLGIATLAGAIVTLGALFWHHRQVGENALATTRGAAAASVAEVEDRARESTSNLESLLASARLGEVGPDEVRAAAEAHLRLTRGMVERPAPELAAYASDIELMPADTNEATERAHLQEFEARLARIPIEAEHRVSGLLARAKDAYELAVAALRARDPRAAQEYFRTARALSYADETVRENASRQLEYVAGLIATAESALQRMVAAREQRRFRPAFELGAEALRTLEGTGLERELRLAVSLRSEPPGAEVYLGGRATGLTTPCLLEYDPTAPRLDLVLRRTAYRSHAATLPGMVELQVSPERIASWTGEIHATLERGPEWVSPDLVNLRDLWVEDEVALCLRSDGRRIHSVDMRTGEPLLGTAAEAGTDEIEQAGRLPDGGAWRLRAVRRLAVATPMGLRWEFTGDSALPFAPATTQGTLCVIDAAGTVYGLESNSGRTLWKTPLGEPPTIAPRTSGLGFLVSTRGGAFAIDPLSGAPRPLLRSTAGSVLGLPFGNGALVLEQGPKGMRIVHDDGRVEVRGAAHPRNRPAPLVSGEGILWMEERGALWAQPGKEGATRLSLVGPDTLHWALRDGTLYTIGAGGRMAAIDLAKPDTLRWELPLGAAAILPPVVLPEHVLVATTAGLMAIRR